MSHTSIISIDKFLDAAGPILDVRSPGEFVQGHIPGAISFPLLTNEERAQVGICYKQQGREQAVELGFDLVGPKLGEFIRRAKVLAPDGAMRVHCWRGGMRSGAIAWALDLAGFDTVTLEGGYKAFRQWVRSALSIPREIVLLGGMTGTAKTNILHALADQGEQVLDLEGHANHRGSSFGALCLPPQPSTEHFENILALEWQRFALDRPVWIEAESRRVGACRIPVELFEQMEAAFALEITRPISERVALLVEIYGKATPADLISATERIRKRLGGQRTQAAIAAIQIGDLATAVSITLDYYDRTYRYGLEQRDRFVPEVDVTGLAPSQAAQQVRLAHTRLSRSQEHIAFVT